jgi:hypothetical protein
LVFNVFLLLFISLFFFSFIFFFISFLVFKIHNIYFIEPFHIYIRQISYIKNNIIHNI